MKINVPEDRTNPMTVKRFISELKYPWSAWIDKKGFLKISYQDEVKASFLPGDDHWNLLPMHFESSIDIPLMQKMLALIKYERDGRPYVLINGKAKFDTNGKKFWHIFILGVDDLQTTIAFEDDLQTYSYSRKQLERFADRCPIELRSAVGILAVPLDEVLANND